MHGDQAQQYCAGVGTAQPLPSLSETVQDLHQSILEGVWRNGGRQALVRDAHGSHQGTLRQQLRISQWPSTSRCLQGSLAANRTRMC